MALCTADFETGTNGNTIATGDTGSATAWNAVTIGTTGALIYDTTHVYGTLAAKVSTGGTSATSYLEWLAALGTPTDWYGRFYLYRTANPGFEFRVLDCATAGGVRVMGLGLSTASKIVVRDTGSTVLGTFTNAITLNQWVRVEFHVVNSTTVGSVEVKLFNSPDSTSVTETATFTGLNTQASTGRFRIGVAVTLANVSAFWLDHVVAGATSYPGPVLGVPPVTMARELV